MSRFEVGEVCESWDARGGAWVDVTIVAIGCTLPAPNEGDYTIEAPRKNPFGGYLWGADEDKLRKKRPPQTDTEIADEDFIKDLNAMIFRDEVKA